MGKILYWIFGIELGASPDAWIITAQLLGLLSCIVGMLCPHMRYRRHMFLLSALANLFAGGNLLIFALHPGKSVSLGACMINFVAVAQNLFNYKRDRQGIKNPVWEKLTFILFYLCVSILPTLLTLKEPLFASLESTKELLPVIAVVFFMIAGWFKMEQTIRLLSVINVATWLIYYLIIGSSMFVSQTVSLFSLAIALWTHRQAKRISKRQKGKRE